MPLENAPVGSPGFGRNVATEEKAGKPEKQAVAIAYSKARGDAIPSPSDVEKMSHEERLKVYKQLLAAGYSSSQAEKMAKLSQSRKDSTSRLDSAFQAADALFSRADAMETGRWDANSFKILVEKRPSGEEYWITNNGKPIPGQHYNSRQQAEAELAKMSKGTSRYSTKTDRKDSERDLPGEATGVGDAVGWGMSTADLRNKINELKKELEGLKKAGRNTYAVEEELKEYKKEYAKY